MLIIYLCLVVIENMHGQFTEYATQKSVKAVICYRILFMTVVLREEQGRLPSVEAVSPTERRGREGVACGDDVEGGLDMARIEGSVNGVKIMSSAVDARHIIQKIQVVELLYSLLYNNACFIDAYYPPMHCARHPQEEGRK